MLKKQTSQPGLRQLMVERVDPNGANHVFLFFIFTRNLLNQIK